ncbi:MAG TPA: prepilin peptidase [Pirellulales bacterium]
MSESTTPVPPQAEQEPLDPRRLWAWRIFPWITPVVGPLWVLGAQALHVDHYFGTIAGFTVLALLLVATYNDVLWKIIPNWATFPAFFWAILLNLWGSIEIGAQLGRETLSVSIGGDPNVALSISGAIGVQPAILGGAVALLAVLLLAAFVGTGFGDAKLALVLGSFLGWGPSLRLVVVMLAVNGISVMIWSAFKHGPFKLIGAVLRRVGSQLAPASVLPPGPEELALLRARFPMAFSFLVAAIIVIGFEPPLVDFLRGGK